MVTFGTCCLCLERRPLTFEHIPPRRVFNNMPAVAHTIFGLHLGSKYKKDPVLQNARRGLGRSTLCEECNGKTAALYGEAFADWTTQCLRYADKLSAYNRLVLSFSIQPLNVLKQIATMIVAVSGLQRGGTTIDGLRTFVLSPKSMCLPADVHFATYFNPVDPKRAANPVLTQNRLAESCAVLDIRSGTSVLVLGEVAFPPMGYVAYSAPPTERVSDDFATLMNLRSFANHQYGRNAGVFMRIPVRYPFGPVPGYYPDLNRPGIHKFLDDDHVLLTNKG